VPELPESIGQLEDIPFPKAVANLSEIDQSDEPEVIGRDDDVALVHVPVAEDEFGCP
jgi:hypothetical protein